MDLVWKLQQENSMLHLKLHELQKESEKNISNEENKRLRKMLATYEVDAIPNSKMERHDSVFSKEELAFIKERGLNRGKIYRQSYKLESAREAIILVLGESY